MTKTAHYVDCQFGQLHYYQQGENNGVVPLICFHMSPYSGRYYEKFQAEMSKDRIVICPDTPGYGGSDAPLAPAKMENLAGAMVEMIDALGFDEVDLLGFHTGVFIATEVALLIPNKIRKLVLPGIPFVPLEKRKIFKNNYENPRPYFDEPEFLCGKWDAAKVSESEGWDEARKIEMFGEVMRCGFRSNWGFLAVFDYDADEKLKKVKQETLIPVADEMLAASTRAAAALFSKATLMELPDLKSDLFEKCPELLLDSVRVFLGKN